MSSNKRTSRSNSELDRRRFLGLGAGATVGLLLPSRAASATGAPSLELAGFEAAGLAELPTPALILDVEAYERNLKRMADHARSSGIGLRPHSKTHKCPVIAKRQLELGAVGICCAKLSEAQVMVENGIGSVLITSPVATREKFELAVALAKKSQDFIMMVDHADAAVALGRLADDAGIVLPVVIGLDTGTRRTGIEPGQPALDLARTIAGIPSLRFRGLQAYAGHVMHIEGHDKRAAASKKALAPCLETRKLFEESGIPVEIFTGGGTGTFDIDSEIVGMTDLQVGSYCFMDVQYRAIGDRDGEVFDVFEPSLFVLTTAISQPVAELITVDAGYKAFANEPNAKPVFADLEGMIYHYGGDEHGIVQFVDPKAETQPLQLGQKARLVVSHCDPTINLYDQIYPVESGELWSPWPILARGRSQ